MITNFYTWMYRLGKKFGCTSEKDLPPINLKLTIPTYFEALITNMMMKVPANLIFKVRIKEKYF